MYTVVVCPECHFVWIVQDRPDRSQCRRCRTSRQFSRLKKYYRDEELENAQRARAQVHARIADDEDHFERALERGVIDHEIDEVVSASEYLDQLGLDGEDIERQADQKLETASRTKSRRDSVIDAIRRQESPSLSDVVEYANEYGVEEDAALELLLDLVESETIELPASIEVSEVEEEVHRDPESGSNQLGGSSAHDPAESENEDCDNGSSPSGESNEKSLNNKEMMLSVIDELDSPAHDEILENVVENGITYDRAERYLQKMLESGTIMRRPDGSYRRV